MTQVSFYSLEEKDTAGQSLACFIAAKLYSDKQRASIWCADKAAAEAFDELLWQQPHERFIPHNLIGEGPQGGAPMQICWQQPDLRRGQSVIVLCAQPVAEPFRFQHIIDFVPLEEAAKQAARERYKYYQRAGCAMQFERAPVSDSADP